MRVPRFDELFLGYYKLEFPPESIPTVLNLILKYNLDLSLQSNSCYISALKYKKISEILSRSVSFSADGPFGLYGLFSKFIRRPVFLISSILCFFLFVLSSFVVWDVRIEGVNEEMHEQIYHELEKAGLSVGRFWTSIDKSKVENQLLIESDTVSWINVNRRGTVAYIKAIEKTTHDEQKAPEGYANIIAERDCVIEEIRVKSGYALVKVGETVKAGQILISGVIPTELGGGLCYAEGVVVGRYSDTVSVLHKRYAEEKVVKEKRCESVYIKFFGFYIKVFKNYRNLPNKYDIIKDERQMFLPEDRRLPFSIVKNFSVSYESIEHRYDDEEIVKLAHLELKEEASAKLRSKELLKMKTAANFVGEDYLVSCEFVCKSSVGKTVVFFAEKTE